MAGFIIVAFLISIPLSKQRDYWKGSYCLHTPYDLDFCDKYKEPTQ